MTRKLKTLAGIATIVACSFAMLASCGPSVPVVPEGDGGIHTFGEGGSDGGTDAADAADVQDSSFVGFDSGWDGSYNFWPAAPGPIVYWGGPIMTQVPNIYLIWYGDWSSSSTPAILEDMVQSFGGTPYATIMSDYYQVPQPEGGTDAGGDAMVIPSGPKTYATGNYSLAKSVNVTYLRGKALGPGDVAGIVTDVLKAGTLPVDTNALYFVLTSSDVTETMDGFTFFCGDYCGYHNATSYLGSPIAYSLVGDPSTCLQGCTAGGALNMNFGVDAGASPNNNWAADGMASVMIHELCESTTDPQVSSVPAWQDQFQSQENGDMCAWRFDPTYATDAGARANVRWGDRDYLIQQMWVNDNDGGRCDLQR